MANKYNHPSEGSKKKGLSDYLVGPGGKSTGKSAKELDSEFRKPFPNLGPTKTGKHG